MGLRISKIGSDPYYANYERSFEKLDGEYNRLKEQVIKIQKQVATYRGWNYLTFGVFLVIAIIHAAWVKQSQSTETYTWKDEASRVGVFFLLLALAYVFHEVCNGYFKWAEGRCERKLKRLQDSKRKMLQDLKDSTRFEKTMELIRKYDEDQRIQTPASTPMGNIGLHSPLSGMPLGPGTPVSMMRRYPSTATAAAAAFSSTGKALMPVFDRLATTLVGDNPTLLNDFRKAQHQLQESHRHAQAAAAESMMFRDQNMQLAKMVQELAGKCNEPVPAWVASLVQASEANAQALDTNRTDSLQTISPTETPKSHGSDFQQLLEAAVEDTHSVSDKGPVSADTSQRSSASGTSALVE